MVSGCVFCSMAAKVVLRDGRMDLISFFFFCILLLRVGPNEKHYWIGSWLSVFC